MTRKLRLEDLRVESFAVDGADAESGTVRGHDAHTQDGPTCRTLVCPCVVTDAISDCRCPTP